MIIIIFQRQHLKGNKGSWQPPDCALVQFNALVNSPRFLSSLPARGFLVIMCKNYFLKRPLSKCLQQDQCQKEQGKIVYCKENYSIVNNWGGGIENAAESSNGTSVILVIKDNVQGKRISERQVGGGVGARKSN